jgi:hypothetical protein
VEWIPAETERGFTNLYNEGSWDGIFFCWKLHKIWKPA